MNFLTRCESVFLDDNSIKNFLIDSALIKIESAE